ncbi:RNA polymerase I-specific transcription initiation factor RRN3 [Sesbania bispinosa]|nr:RNA polymerase I-specific transcription initiation factor RRN3 [Sesbania bispinosa]
MTRCISPAISLVKILHVCASVGASLLGKHGYDFANYALGTLGGDPLDTTGIIELGGASAQVTFVSRDTMLPALVDRLIELDMEIEWDGILQEDAKGIFELELDDAEFAYEDEKYYTMSSAELFNRKNLQGNSVVEKLDSLMVLISLHLESSQSSGRLSEAIMYVLGFQMRSLMDVPRLKLQLLKGETYAGKRQPTLFVINITSGEVQAKEMINLYECWASCLGSIK